MVIIRHSSRRALQSIYTSKNIIANYGNYCNKRIFNTDLCLSQTERSEGEKGMIVKMEDNKFNNYNLTNDEVSKILIDFENIIKSKASKLGKYKED